MALDNADEDFVGEQLPFSCQVDFDPDTGETLADEDMIVDDAGYTVRAWMAVVTYLLSDYRFLYE